MNQVFVVFGDEFPAHGLSGSADDRKILAVTDTVEKARELVRSFEKSKVYEYVDFKVMGLKINGNKDWEAIAGYLKVDNTLLRQEIEKLKDLMVLAKVQSSHKDCKDILQNAIDNAYVDIDYYVAKDLMEAHARLIVPDQDEGGNYLEPDYKVIEAIEVVLSYYMPKDKFDEWFRKVQADKIRLWAVLEPNRNC